ncbi:hypothetical protein QW060_25040 [Myroides ceti]|uniref:Transposase n=1 Tax=Paenimyroides ceti TaxID=395087 RepID=A0ABT8D1F7_9FLAO|nr:hypothetical protein [Paenimyroides ceti]MDN3710146.1 hypothetical protein [Paenimyroides ceti]
MKNRNLNVAQIVKILQEYDLVNLLRLFCREYGIAAPTFYSWKKKYSGMSSSAYGVHCHTILEMPLFGFRPYLPKPPKPQICYRLSNIRRLSRSGYSRNLGT